MAVKQRIVRISQSSLSEASVDTDALERLLRFDLAGPEDTLDLDWAPNGLLALARRSFTEGQVAALRDILEGSKLLNEECAAGPQHDPVYSDVTCLVAPEVQRAAGVLAGLTSTDILRALPATWGAQREVIGAGTPDDPPNYYKEHFSALLNFAQGAADQELCLVQWWD